METQPDLEASRILARRFFEEILNRSEPEDVAEIVTEDYCEWATPICGGEAPGRINGPEHLRRVARGLHAAYPDIHTEVERVIADGDEVAAYVTASGTNTGGISEAVAPTGKRFSVSQCHWFRVRNGRLAEHWATREDLPMLVQLGMVDCPEM